MWGSNQSDASIQGGVDFGIPPLFCATAGLFSVLKTLLDSSLEDTASSTAISATSGCRSLAKNFSAPWTFPTGLLWCPPAFVHPRSFSLPIPSKCARQTTLMAPAPRALLPTAAIR